MSVGKIRLFATDLDGTLLGDDSARRKLLTRWSLLPDDARPLLCYNTGRMLDDVLQLIERRVLAAPDYIISGVGTNIYDYHAGSVVEAFSEILEEGWDSARVEAVIGALALPLEKQPAHFQTAFKSSWYLHDAGDADIAALRRSLDDAGLETHVVYSSGRHLDMLPHWANKGNALRWLLQRLDIAPQETLVAGDSGNDSAMFTFDGINGIIVGNAQPELVRLSLTPCSTAPRRRKYAPRR